MLTFLQCTVAASNACEDGVILTSTLKLTLPKSANYLYQILNGQLEIKGFLNRLPCGYASNTYSIPLLTRHITQKIHTAKTLM